MHASQIGNISTEYWRFVKSINFKITARFTVKKSKLDVYINFASSEVGEVVEISVSWDSRAPDLSAGHDKLFNNSDRSAYGDKTVGFSCMLLRTIKAQHGWEGCCPARRIPRGQLSGRDRFSGARCPGGQTPVLIAPTRWGMARLSWPGWLVTSNDSRR